jgi:hypothetical protein
MQPPLFIRPLSAVEEQELKAALRSRDAFTLRRSQIWLASARGDRSTQIAEYLGCTTRLCVMLCVPSRVKVWVA